MVLTVEWEPDLSRISQIFLVVNRINCGCLIKTAREQSCSDTDPVPGIDRCNRHDQIDELFLVKMLADAFVYLCRNAGLGQLGDALCQFDDGPFLVGIYRNFAPHGQKEEAVHAFAHGEQILGMHIHAEGATVDLGCPELNDFVQLVIESAFLGRLLQGKQGFEGFRIG